MALRHNGSHDIAVLGRLPSKERAVVVLRHFEHRSESDTAEILGTSIGAVRTQAQVGDGLDGLLVDAAEIRG